MAFLPTYHGSMSNNALLVESQVGSPNPLSQQRTQWYYCFDNLTFSYRSGKQQWIGATDAGHEGIWTWTNGAPVRKSESHWYPGEPNNCCGGQNCAVSNFAGRPGIWDDQGCTLKRPFHCQVSQLQHNSSIWAKFQFKRGHNHWFIHMLKESEQQWHFKKSNHSFFFCFFLLDVKFS